MASPCWNFTGALTDGYGRAYVDGRLVITHRAAYEVLVGPIPAGLTLDHLCRNKACYNPAHLEPVTRAENLRRGWQHRELKTHCPRGHEYAGRNLYVSPKGWRICRLCQSGLKRASRG